jgi:iron complex transport system ATP-binding protein
VQSLHAQTGLAAVLVCHELEVLPPCCQRVVLLDQGRIIGVGAPEEVFTGQRVATLYGPGLRAVHGGGRHAVIPIGGAR